MGKRRRVVYLDALRIIAITAVVMMHTTAIQWRVFPVDGQDWSYLNYYNSAVRWAVPVFVMISGSLFLDPERKISYGRLYKKNAVRLIAAFAIWSLIYTAIRCWGGHRAFTTMLAMFIKGHYHLWYIPMLLGLYVIVPLLRPITADMKLTKYFVALAIFFTFAVPTLNVFLQSLDWTGNEGRWKLIRVLFYQIQSLRIMLPLGYASYFVLGSFLSRVEFKRWQRWGIYLLGIAGYVTTVKVTASWSLASGIPTGFNDNLYINVLAEAVAVFVLAKQLGTKFERIPILNSATLARLTFGIYLIHPLFIRIATKQLQLYPDMVDVRLGVPLMGIALIAVSFIAVFIMDKIPVIRKYMI